MPRDKRIIDIEGLKVEVEAETFQGGFYLPTVEELERDRRNQVYWYVPDGYSVLFFPRDQRLNIFCTTCFRIGSIFVIFDEPDPVDVLEN